MNKQSIDRSLLSEFLHYLKKPIYDISIKQAPWSVKFWDIMRFWSLGLALAFGVGLVSTIFLQEVGVDDSQNILPDFFLNTPTIYVILLVFFLGPISEELTFRLPLRYTSYGLGVFFTFFLILILEIAVALNYQLKGIADNYLDKLGIANFLLILLAFIIGFSWLAGSVLNVWVNKKRIEEFYKKYFIFLFYASVVIFALAHVFNFSNYKEIWLASIFLVAPQLFLALILSFIRMRYGLTWSIVYHVMHNSLASLSVLFLAQVSNETIEMLIEHKITNIASIPEQEQNLLVLGGFSALWVFVLFVVSFISFIKDYKQHKKIVP